MGWFVVFEFEQIEHCNSLGKRKQFQKGQNNHSPILEEISSYYATFMMVIPVYVYHICILYICGEVFFTRK